MRPFIAGGVIVVSCLVGNYMETHQVGIPAVYWLLGFFTAYVTAFVIVFLDNYLLQEILSAIRSSSN
jgi:hypothetical protein